MVKVLHVPACRVSLPARAPVQVPFFDDGASYFHGLLGLVAAVVPRPAAAAIAAGFLVYQMREIEPLPSKVGDLSEFALGFLAAGMLGGAK